MSGIIIGGVRVALVEFDQGKPASVEMTAYASKVDLIEGLLDRGFGAAPFVGYGTRAHRTALARVRTKLEEVEKTLEKYDEDGDLIDPETLEDG